MVSSKVDQLETNNRVVNSWNEWDQLEEIVIGRADGACFSPEEIGHRPKIRDPHIAAAIRWPKGPKKSAVTDAANEQLDALADLMSSESITVRRPSEVDFNTPIKTPTFAVENMYCSTCPRDVMITLGNEILEATMSRRARFFEYLCYRDLVLDYFKRDPDMLWTAAPKPSMADEMYSPEFWEWSLKERHERMHNYQFTVRQREPVFDAADISRFGRDVFIQESMTTNRPGIRWLKKHLQRQGLRLHVVHFPYDLFPSHIDCTFVPLRPGLVLTNPDRPIAGADAKIFRDNGWEFVDAPQPTSSNDEMPAFCQSSKWLSMNVLSLNRETVICEASEKPLIKLLKELGFTVFDIPFRSVFEFGGSLHCATWDVRRRGVCEDYFPKQPAGKGNINPACNPPDRPHTSQSHGPSSRTDPPKH